MKDVPLEELATIVSGATPSTAVSEYWGGDIAWITPADLTNHEGIYFRGRPKRITEKGFNNCPASMLPPGAILFSSRAPIGHCAVLDYAACTNQGFKSIVPGERLDPVYGFFALKFLTPSIVAKGRGATFAEINKELMEEIRIPYCDLATQRRIAIRLERADRLRRMRRYALHMCDDSRRSVVKEFCKRHLTNSSKHLFGDEDIMQIIDGDRGKAYPNGTDFAKNGDCLFLNTGNVLNRAFDFADCDFISLQKDKELRKGKLVRGDIVLTTRGTLGNNALYDTSFRHEHVRINSGMVILRVNASKLLPEYLVAILNSDGFINQVLALTSGSAQQQLPISVLSTVTLQLPIITLQQELVNTLRRQHRLRATHVEALRQADHLFQTLLHQAFSDSR